MIFTRLFKSVLLTLSLFFSFNLYSQNEVTWEITPNETSPGEYYIILKGSYEKTSRIYITDDAEVKAPKLEFDQTSGFELIDDLEIKGRKTEASADIAFKGKAAKDYITKKIVLRQKIRVTEPTLNLTGKLWYTYSEGNEYKGGQSLELNLSLNGNSGGLIPSGDGVLKPAKFTFNTVKIGENQYELHINGKIQQGWKIYSNTTPPDGPLPTILLIDEELGYDLEGDINELSEVKTSIEPLFDNIETRYFTKTYSAIQTFSVSDDVTHLKGGLEFMACDALQCLPPKEVFDINLSTGVNEFSAANLEVENSDDWKRIKGLNNPLANCGGVKDEEGKSMMTIFLLGFIGGLLALLTPCVFPMIPLTVSFFTKSSKTKKKGLINAITYGFFIFLIYLLLSSPFHLLDQINPNILNEISTNVVLNIIFFVIFIVFAISFFGYFEITLPSSWINKADSASNVGGLIGTFFMALTLAIVSFSCTGPILGGLLAGSLTSDGGAWQLTAGMGGFGLALALPFALFAMFPGWLNNLPKSGGWLNTVKVVLGFVELALAMKFLSQADLVSHWGILLREIFFAVWIIIGILIVLYLFGKIKFPHDSPGVKFTKTRIFFIALFSIFTIYLLPGVTNTEYANRKLMSGFPPPLFYSIYEKDSKCPLDLPCFKDYYEGLAYAKEVNKPIMIDFTGWACTNCRRMEEKVWAKKEIFDLLSKEFVIISLYVDDKAPLDDDEVRYAKYDNDQVERLTNVGKKWAYFQFINTNKVSQPLYVLISPEEYALNNAVGYTPNVTEYKEFLECGLNAFKEQQQKSGVAAK